MADDPDVKIRVGIDGRSVRRAIDGITTDITKAEKERTKATKKADADATKSTVDAAKKRTKAEERHVSAFKRGEESKRREAIARAREILDDFRKNERRKREELARTLRETQMSERQRARLIARTERQIASDRSRSVRDARGARGGTSGRGSAVLGGVLAGGAAVAGAGLNAVNRMASAGGVRSREQLLQESLTFNRDLAALSAQSGLDAESLRARINAAATSSGRDQMELLESLQLNQGRFGGIDAAVANLENLSQAAVGANASVGALSLAVGTAGAVYGLSSEEADDYLHLMLSIGEAGSIEAENLAETFAPYMGVYQRATGQTGAGGAESATRFAGLMGTSFANDSEAKTLAEAALRQINSQDVQQRLALATGGRMQGRGANRTVSGGMRISADGALGGQVTDPLEAIRQLQSLGLSPGQLQRILGDSSAAQGVGVIGTALNTEQGRAIMNASADDGRASVARGLASQESVNRAGRDLDRARAESFAAFQQNGDAYTRAVIRSTEEMGRLNATYPGATEGLETLKDAAVGLAGIFAATKLAALGGAGAAGVGVAGGAAGAGVAGGAAAAGAGAMAATAAVGTAVGLGIGRGLTSLVDRVTGNNQATQASDDMFGALFSADRTLTGEIWAGIQELRAGPTMPASPEEMRRHTEANTRALEDSSRAQRDLAEALRTRALDTGGDVE